jgi:hypothetical protein
LNNADFKENRLLPNIDDIQLCKSPEFGAANAKNRVNSIPSGAATST